MGMAAHPMRQHRGVGQEEADAKQLDDLLKQLKQLESQNPSPHASQIFRQHHELLEQSSRLNDQCRHKASMVLEKLSYHVPDEVWQDVHVRQRIVDFVQPPDNPAALNSSMSVPWQKHGAQIFENITYSEHVASVFLRRASDDDPDTWYALKQSCASVRASTERSCALAAMGNLATLQSNRADMWKDPEARKILVQGLNVRQIGGKPVRESASRALANLAEDPVVRNEMAQCKAYRPVWEFVVAKKVVSDELLEFASTALGKLDGVECTGERTKEKIDQEKRKHAIEIDLKEDEARTPEAESSTRDGKRAKREHKPLLIGPPSSHNGTRDSNAALGAAFATGLRSNAGTSSSSTPGPSGMAPGNDALPMETIIAKLRSNFPSSCGQSVVSLIGQVEDELYGQIHSGPLMQRALRLLQDLSCT